MIMHFKRKLRKESAAGPTTGRFNKPLAWNESTCQGLENLSLSREQAVSKFSSLMSRWDTSWYAWPDNWPYRNSNFSSTEKEGFLLIIVSNIAQKLSKTNSHHWKKEDWTLVAEQMNYKKLTHLYWKVLLVLKKMTAMQREKSSKRGGSPFNNISMPDFRSVKDTTALS